MRHKLWNYFDIDKTYIVYARPYVKIFSATSLVLARRKIRALVPTNFRLETGPEDQGS